MLQAILHGKLDRWLSKDAYTIEDLLTSVVLGSTCYAPHEQALLPFLRKAIDERGSTLAAHLTDVASVTAEFWPNWRASEVEPDEDDTADNDDGDESDAKSPDAPRASGITVARSQPEVVIEVAHTDGRRQLILIEAKLHSGKSSHASGDGVVTDQLAKYWLHLQKEAARRSAEALAVVYLTKGSRRPHEELEASQRDLEAARCQRAPLYWLSWRELAGVVDVPSASPILRDCVTLLRERWQMEKVSMGSWPNLPPLPPPFVFGRRFSWAQPTQPQCRWSFDERPKP